MNDGRPLRFLGLTLGGWTAIRVVMLWPAVQAPAVATPATGDRAAPVAAATAPLARDEAVRAAAPLPSSAIAPAVVALRRGGPVPLAPGGGAPARVAVPVAATVAAAAAVPSAGAPALPPPLVPTPIARSGTGHWSASAWLIARDGARGALQGGQLGDSQAGMRVSYALDAGRRVALTARASAPLRGRGAEAALGLAWQPPGLPVQFIAEQRIALNGGRGGPTLLAAGGLNPRPVAAGLTLEAYAQAGVIARNGGEGFADGAARLVRPVAERGGLRLDLGAGAWGGAQRGTERIDLGPTIGVAVPAGDTTLRLTLDWRVRVARRAAPGSGPALSLGTDF